jgi:hypothetical protein
LTDEQLSAALDRLVAPAAVAPRGWNDVQRRARRLRRRRRSLLAVAALGAALFSALAAAGQIGSFTSHSKAPHLTVRAALYEGSRRAGSLEVEVDRATVAVGRRVRVLGFRLPSQHGFGFRARWFLELDRGLPSGVLVVGGTRQRLCSPCGAGASGELQLTRAQVTSLVNDEARFTGGDVSGRLALDRLRLHRGVMCLPGAEACTRIYTGRP